MAIGRWERVFHYHLRKCGGTSLNAWLALRVADRRGFRPEWMHPFDKILLDEQKPEDTAAPMRDFAARATSVFHWSDVAHTHVPLGPHVPEGTFRFTVLRNPIDRVVSQIADWRRFDPATYTHPDPGVTAAIRDLGSTSMRDFLIRHARTTFPFVFDNHLTRALAGSQLGMAVVGRHDLAVLEAIARRALHRDFDFVGLAEEPDATLATLADRLGQPVPPAFPRLNETRSGVTLADEAREAADILADLTGFDEKVHATALELFEAGAVREDRATLTARFDAVHAADAVRGLRGVEWRGHTVHSVRDPLVGWGILPRDAAETENCRVWTGPTAETALYMPAPVGLPIEIRVWVHGYAAERQREALRVAVDGRPVAHRFEPAEGWREAIVVPARATAPVIRLDLAVDAAVDTVEAGFGPGDDRRRGISFDRYGWCPAA